MDFTYALSYKANMISVVIECDNQEAELARTLSALVKGAIDGIVSDVTILDRGSRDGTAKVADAAGCALYQHSELEQVLGRLRGAWVLIIEPGARPVNAWIDGLADHVSNHSRAARFSPSKTYRIPFFQRILKRSSPLEYGLLLPAQEARAHAKGSKSLKDLAKSRTSIRLASELVPASYKD